MMNMNQIRILEAIYAYLVSRTDPEVQEVLNSENLIFSHENRLYKFKTYQAKSNNYVFIDYRLGNFELDEEQHVFYGVHDTYKAFNLEDSKVSTLRELSNIDIARSQIFKLLHQIDAAYLEERYPKLKTDSYAYDVYLLETDKFFPIYKFSESASFELVGMA